MFVQTGISQAAAEQRHETIILCKSGDQRSRAREAEDRFRGLVEAFLTPLGRAVLVAI